jgi:hypothetical protein
MGSAKLLLRRNVGEASSGEESTKCQDYGRRGMI